MAGEWFVLEPLDGGARTRLIVRTGGGWLEPLARTVPALWPILWPIAAFVDRVPGELLHHVHGDRDAQGHQGPRRGTHRGIPVPVISAG